MNTPSTRGHIRDDGVFLAPSLWLPQSSPWSLAALSAVADALLAAGCRVRVYDADFAGGHPLARHLYVPALGGPWPALAGASALPWWELPLGSVARGEHALLWPGSDATPPSGWPPLVSRAQRRGLPVSWLPGLPSLGLPNLPGSESHEFLPMPQNWLGLTFWTARPPLPRRVLDRWRRGESPGFQTRQQGLWWHRNQARRARKVFAVALEEADAGV